MLNEKANRHLGTCNWEIRNKTLFWRQLPSSAYTAQTVWCTKILKILAWKSKKIRYHWSILTVFYMGEIQTFLWTYTLSPDSATTVDSDFKREQTHQYWKHSFRSNFVLMCAFSNFFNFFFSAFYDIKNILYLN